jgi:hypothetical protein
MQKYSVNQHLIETLLTWVKSGEIAIPEIQRPFVWDSTKVRDLIDSLYQGYPIGYVIAWRNPNVRLKDGSLSEGKKILIDGQQRVTALTAAILGEYVINKTYQRVKIKIAFHPILEKFEVQNPAIAKDKTWIPDISEVISGNTGILKLVRHYLELNPDANEDIVEKAFTALDEEAKWIAAARGGDVDAGTKLLASIKSDASTLKFANKSAQIMGSTLGSFGEARAEAIGAKDEFVEISKLKHNNVYDTNQAISQLIIIKYKVNN